MCARNPESLRNCFWHVSQNIAPPRPGLFEKWGWWNV
jgi:hypothetical protein